MNRSLRICLTLLALFPLPACRQQEPIVAPEITPVAVDKKPTKKCTDYASEHVVPLGSVVMPVHDAADIVVSGSLACVALGNAGLGVVDVANANHPKMVGRLRVSAGKVAIAGERVVITSASGLYVVDVSTPSAPSVVGSLTRPMGPGLAATDQFAYVSSIDHDNNIGEDVDSLLVVDLAQPGSPHVVWREGVTIGGEVDNISLSAQHQFLFVAWGYSDADRVSSWNVSIPSMPTRALGGANILQLLRWCAVTDSRVYYVNIDPPFNSLLAYGLGADGDMTGGGPDHNTYVQGMNPVCGALCVSGDNVFSVGASCLSVTDAQTLERVAEIDLPASLTPKAIAAGGGFVYVVGDEFDVYPGQCSRHTTVASR